MKKIQRRKSLVLISVLIIILLVAFAVLITNNNDITQSEKEEIENYIKMIYGFYGETLPEFEDVNDANEDWMWMVTLYYLQETNESGMYTSEEVKEAGKILYGDNFNKEISKDSSKFVLYFEDTHRYRLVGMSFEEYFGFVTKNVTKKGNKYIVDIVEYIKYWERDTDLDPGREIIMNAKSEEITSFNRKITSASNDEERKLLELENESIEAEIKGFVLKNSHKFKTKELMIERDKETGLLHILASKDK